MSSKTLVLQEEAPTRFLPFAFRAVGIRHQASGSWLRVRWVAFAALGAGLLLALGGCASGGRYGYARTYIPTGAEEDAAEAAETYDPVMSRRKEHEWVGKKISVFGVIESIDRGKGGDDVLLSIRNLQDRNLCLTHDEDSCRVTVTDTEFAKLHAAVNIDPSEEKVGPGSLLRVIGVIREEPHPKTGNWVIEAEFYRHWPGGEFVTLKQREFMRQ